MKIAVAAGLFLCQWVVAFSFSYSTPEARTIDVSSRSSSLSSVSLYSKPDGMSGEEYEAKMEKATKAMTAFSNKYLKNTGTKLCKEKSVPAVVIKGLAEHKGTGGR